MRRAITAAGALLVQLSIAACGGTARQPTHAEQRPISAAATQDDEAEARPAEGMSCVLYRPFVRYGNQGYDHWVELQSQCDSTARCQITTDANPDGVAVVLDGGATQEVMVFRGSPAREFSTTVTCDPDV